MPTRIPIWCPDAAYVPEDNDYPEPTRRDTFTGENITNPNGKDKGKGKIPAQQATQQETTAAPPPPQQEAQPEQTQPKQPLRRNASDQSTWEADIPLRSVESQMASDIFCLVCEGDFFRPCTCREEAIMRAHAKKREEDRERRWREAQQQRKAAAEARAEERRRRRDEEQKRIEEEMRYQESSSMSSQRAERGDSTTDEEMRYQESMSSQRAERGDSTTDEERSVGQYGEETSAEEAEAFPSFDRDETAVGSCEST